MGNSWKQASDAGEARYFTGRPCRAGHIVERFTNNRNCVECAASSGARSFAKKYHTNPEFAAQRNTSAKEWKKANRPKVNRTVKQWFAKNPGKNSEYCKKWRKDNPEKARANSRRFAEKNRHKRPLYVANWERKNPERAAAVKRASKINRRTREMKNGGTCTANDIKFLIEKQNGKCANCKQKKKLEVDHILAVKLGGSSDRKNLQLLCKPCNRAKSDKDPIVWAQEKGRLL